MSTAARQRWRAHDNLASTSSSSGTTTKSLICIRSTPYWIHTTYVNECSRWAAPHIYVNILYHGSWICCAECMCSGHLDTLLLRQRMPFCTRPLQYMRVYGLSWKRSTRDTRNVIPCHTCYSASIIFNMNGVCVCMCHIACMYYNYRCTNLI